MTLRKDDPIYYKNKINDLIKQANKEGLKISTDSLNDGVRISFKADNGDTASVVIDNY